MISSVFESIEQYIKALLLKAWRERWPEEKWSLSMKPFMKIIKGNDDIVTDVLLDQALVGAVPIHHLLAYLKHAMLTQMVSYSCAVKSIVRFGDMTRPYCAVGLVNLIHEHIDLFLCNMNADDSLTVAKCLHVLLSWSLDLLSKSLQKLVELKSQSEKTEIYVTVVEKTCALISHLTKSTSRLTLLYIAGLEGGASGNSLSLDKGSSSVDLSPIQGIRKSFTKESSIDDTSLMEQLISDCKKYISELVLLTTEQKSKVSEALKFDLSAKNFTLVPKQIIDLSCHSLNISINVLVSKEAILTPLNDISVVVEEIHLLERMQGISRPQLYCELIRSSFLGIIDIFSRPDELKWAAFTYLKLPNILHRLVQQSADEDRLLHLEEGFEHLLLYVPLLDLSDTKYNCDCLHFLLNELCNKYSIMTDVQCRKIMNKRQSETLKPKPQELLSTNQTPNLILRAEPTVTSILKTLDADYTKNQDSLLGVLCQMMSGKSFELILSAAAATGKLQIFAIKLIKFNEFSKMASGETGKGAQMRALLFDISFLMLCHITQLYGAEVIVSNQECLSSFFVQWVVRCLPEDGKYKSLDLMSSAEANKLDIVLVQLTPGGELKTNLTRWQDVCHNTPYAIQEVLMAWESGVIDEDTVKTVMENAKSSMCCLPIVVSTWLCSYINICNVDCRQKALFMLQQLLAPLSTETNQSAGQYFAERSNLMQVILGKIVHELLPSESIPRVNPSAFLLPSKTATRDILIETFQRISNKGCIDIDDLHKMNYLLNIGGPQWFCENLVRDVLRHDRPEDLHKGVGLLYSLFHLDLENLTLCLLHHTLPNLLQSTGPSVRLLIDPRGSSLAKLCVMCLAVLHAMRQQPKEVASTPRGRKRTRADVQLEDGDEAVDEDRPTKMDLGDSGSLCNDVFNMGEFLSCAGRDDDSDCAMQYDSKDLLTRTLVNLFRLFYGILVDKLISPRSNFVISFIMETLRTGQATTRFIFQFMPPNMVNLLVKSLGNALSTDNLIQLSDLTTQSGRRAAARVVCQNVRFQVQMDAVTLPAS